jgi:hypothetical protein
MIEDNDQHKAVTPDVDRRRLMTDDKSDESVSDKASDKASSKHQLHKPPGERNRKQQKDTEKTGKATAKTRS